MRRSSIIITSVCGLILIGFWGGVYFLTQFFPNSQKEIFRSEFKSTVSIVQDIYGVPVITSRNRQDLLRAQGLVTARDRFFQMELIRRKMAGELSELFGEKAIDSDVMHRRLGFSQVAERAWGEMDPATKEVWGSFAEGVNSYLKSEKLPWEIKTLGYKPKEWRGQDGLLVVLSMFEALNDYENGEELAYDELFQRFSRPIVDFLTWDFGFLDAPLKLAKGVSLSARIPNSTQIDLRSQSSISSPVKIVEKDVYGSNAWVVSGKLTESGKPLLAGDPHLNLTVPNIWYRSELKDDEIDVRGVSVPGIPGIVIGKNKSLAWSFTNSRADVQDFINLEKDFNEQNTSEDFKNRFKLSSRIEIIQVKGGANINLQCWDTIAGPILSEKVDEINVRKRILQWTALDSSALSKLNPLELDSTRDLSQLWDSLSRWGGPVQNILVATQDGHIAWGIVGKIPDSRPEFGKVSVDIKNNSAWKGYVPWAEMPRVVDPVEGFIASGNQNMWIEANGKYRWGHDWPSPARGFEIRKRLTEKDKVSSKLMNEIQNDLYSPVHVWYRDKLIDAIKNLENQPNALSPEVEVVLNLVGPWNGMVTADSAAYTFMREFRLRVLNNAVTPFVSRTSPSRQQQVMNLIAKDSVIYMLLSQKPFHLLNPVYSSWDDLLLSTAKEVSQSLVKEPKELMNLKWGNRNLLQAKHPFSAKLPAVLGKLLNLPEKPLSGDGLVVRVAKPKNGSSMRMIIDWAEEGSSTFSQPGGQSGYFLSPHYQDLFESWYLGEGIKFENADKDLEQLVMPKS